MQRPTVFPGLIVSSPAHRVVHLLTYLRDLAQRGGGYELRGAFGWVTAADVANATAIHGAGDELRAAFQRGQLVREDVSIPDARNPVWVYHVADQAARSNHEKHAADRPDSPRYECRVYLRPGPAVALDAMRHAFHNSTSRRPRIPGEPEWRTCRELSGWLRDEGDRTGAERTLMSDDLAWVVRNGLAERRELPPPNSFTSAAVVVYRLTVTGAAVHPLVWHKARELDVFAITAAMLGEGGRNRHFPIGSPVP